jgi:predicted Zn-dependent protease
MAPGEAESLDDLAELVGDGIYVTRVHYPGVVNPREGVITGMTRDGTFRIRNGKVAEPLVNLRFTVSMPDLLADVPGLTRDVQLVNQSDFYDERYPYAYLVPGLATASFNVTGAGSGPGL